MIGGYKIIESSLATTRRVKRVRGGYLNRWLVRAVVEEPAFFVSEANGTMYVHPELLKKLRAERHGARP